jgi:hypothetical protein
VSKLNLSDQLAAERKPKPTSLETWIASLDSDDRDALESARFDDDLKDAAIRRVMANSGHPVGKETIAKWRRG